MNIKIKNTIKNILFPFNILLILPILVFGLILSPLFIIIFRTTIKLLKKIGLRQKGYGFELNKENELYYIETKEREINKGKVGLLIERYKRREIWLINENNWEGNVEEWLKSRRLEIRKKIQEDPFYKNKFVE
jgi:hypothetical protein